MADFFTKLKNFKLPWRDLTKDNDPLAVISVDLNEASLEKIYQQMTSLVD